MKLMLVTACSAAALAAAPAQAQDYGPWGDPVDAEDPVAFPHSSDQVSEAGTGCPILDPYTKDLFVATNRGDTGAPNDIYRARWNGGGWDAAVPVGDTVNTAAAEYCPSPARGRRFFFVRAGDIYSAKMLPNRQIGRVTRLGEEVNLSRADGSPASEWSPSYVEGEDGSAYLYFSSDADGTQDIWVSRDGAPAEKIAELSSNGGNEFRPNVRRDRLEMLFDRDGLIWSSSRASTSDPWGEPVVVIDHGVVAGPKSRAALSWDGTMMVFGSGGIVYVAERSKN